jgi:membrane glycosyltransferase
MKWLEFESNKILVRLPTGKTVFHISRKIAALRISIYFSGVFWNFFISASAVRFLVNSQFLNSKSIFLKEFTIIRLIEQFSTKKFILGLGLMLRFWKNWEKPRQSG